MKLRKRIIVCLTSFLLLLSSLPLAYGFNLDAAQAYNKALDLYINGKTTDAIIQFQEAVRLDPEFADAYYNLGSIYRYTNQLSKAEEAFQKVLSLKPDDTSVNYDLALIYVQKNDYKRALSFLNLVTKESERFNDAKTKISLLKSEMNLMEMTTAKSAPESTHTNSQIDKVSQSETKKEPEKQINDSKTNAVAKESKKDKIEKLSAKAEKETKEIVLNKEEDTAKIEKAEKKETTKENKKIARKKN